MSGFPIGQGTFGRHRFGDEVANGTLPRTATLGLSWSISGSQYGASTRLSCTIQVPKVAILQLYCLIAAPTQFAINGDGSIVSPDQVAYIPRSVVARDLLGSPLFGGFTQMTWTYTTIQQAEAHYLLSFYDPTNPVVLLTFPDDNGLWVQRRATMLPPNYGSWETVVVTNLVLSFLLLSS